ncbi:MAG: DNA/RNA nuclease SfsA [Desulfovibrionales bacterium]|nr:DNA/RNA nuclease SfsA [Desulfovibrionales bacterium]
MNPFLPFPPHSCQAVFVAREKRFLVHVVVKNKPVTIHTNNSGSMLGLLRPGMDVFISPASNPKRKLPYTLELVRPHKQWIGVNTATPNRLLRRIWETRAVPEFAAYPAFQSEVRQGLSRLDARLHGPGGELWIEAKNVTMVEDEVAMFPDAVTERGQKHVRELIALARQGIKVAIFLAIQRNDARCFGPADCIDPAFARLFWQAVDCGVQILPYTCLVSPQGIALGARLPLTRP